MYAYIYINIYIYTRAFAQLQQDAAVETRRNEIDEFNNANQWVL